MISLQSSQSAATLQTSAVTKLGMAVNIVEILIKQYRDQGYLNSESIILALSEFAAKPILADTDPALLETLVRSREIERQLANKELN